MAVDRWSLEYHLTPRGWVVGTSTFFDKVEEPVTPRPDDAVETWLETGYQRSAFSREENTFSRTWVNPAASEDVIRALHERYPDDDRDRASEPPADPQ